MAKSPRSGSSSEPANSPTDLYPTSDIRFVMIKIGELSSKVDRLIEDVGSHGEKIDALRHQITFVRGALWVLGFVVVAVSAMTTWYLSGKIAVTIKPPL